MEKECVQFFKKNKGFHRLLKGIKEKYRSLGTLGGVVKLYNLTVEEKDSLSGFFRKDYYSKKSASIKVENFINAFEKTKFQGVDLEVVLRGYFGGELISKKEENELYLVERELFFEQNLQPFKDTKAHGWLAFVLESKSNVYRILCQKYDRDKKGLKELLVLVMSGLNMLSFEATKLTRLALFSSIVSKNPHTFDQDTEAGNLLLYGIVYFIGESFPNNAEGKAEILYRAGLIKDEISNYSTFSGLIGYQNEQIHQGWNGFYEKKEPLNITLWNLSEVDCIKSPQNKVFVFENPTVFSQVLQELRDKNPSLICTYGQIKLASFVLMDKLVDNVDYIYYSGDFDPEGLQIADKLKKRYGEKLIIWRYSVEEYEAIKSHKKLEPSRMKKLETIENHELKILADYIKNEGFAGYQELLITRYIKDINALIN